MMWVQNKNKKLNSPKFGLIWESRYPITTLAWVPWLLPGYPGTQSLLLPGYPGTQSLFFQYASIWSLLHRYLSTRSPLLHRYLSTWSPLLPGYASTRSLLLPWYRVIEPIIAHDLILAMAWLLIGTHT